MISVDRRVELAPEHTIYNFVKTHTKPLRMALGGLLVWTATACSPISTPISPSILEESSSKSSEVFYRKATLTEREDLRRVALEFINPAYFSSELSLPSENDAGYVPQARTTEATAPGKEAFSIFNTYREGGELTRTIIRPGVMGPPPIFHPERIPGITMSEAEFAGLPTEKYPGVMSSIYNLPESMVYRFGTALMALTGDPREQRIAIGEGQDEKGRHYSISMTEERTANLTVTYP